MPTPKELSDRFIRACNERDRVAICALLPSILEYVRPGGGKLTTAEEVMAQYERDLAVLTSSSVEVRELLESDDGIMAEITGHDEETLSAPARAGPCRAGLPRARVRPPWECARWAAGGIGAGAGNRLCTA